MVPNVSLFVLDISGNMAQDFYFDLLFCFYFFELVTLYDEMD